MTEHAKLEIFVLLIPLIDDLSLTCFAFLQQLKTEIMGESQKIERISSGDIVDDTSTEFVSRKEHHGVTLIPHPSEDPLDPLVSRTFTMAKH